MRSSKPVLPYIPLWIWKPLALSLGIKDPVIHNWPIISLILYLLLLSSSMLFASSSLFFTFYHVKKLQLENKGIFNESFTLIFGAFWCSIGLYGNNLAYKTLSTKQLVKSIRLHTKTFLKMNLGVMVSLLSVLFITLHLKKMSKIWMSPQTCQSVNLPNWICYSSFSSLAVFSTLSTIWNLSIFVIILSITRTHTLLLRDFLKELDLDALAHHRLHLLNHGQNASNKLFRDTHIGNLGLNAFDWTLQFDDEDDEDVLKNCRKTLNYQTIQPLEDLTNIQESTSSNICTSDEINTDNRSLFVNSSLSTAMPTTQSIEQLRELIISDRVDIEAYSPFILSEERLINRYWILQRRLKVVSHVFQRWVVSWIGFVVLWTLSYIIHWIVHGVDLLDLALFIVPLLLVFQLFSSYSEVNNEADSFRKYIYPTPNRLPLLKFWFSQPLQLFVFNMPVNYTTMLKIILVFSVAFISRIVVDEINSNP